MFFLNIHPYLIPIVAYGAQDIYEPGIAGGSGHRRKRKVPYLRRPGIYVGKRNFYRVKKASMKK